MEDGCMLTQFLLPVLILWTGSIMKLQWIVDHLRILWGCIKQHFYTNCVLGVTIQKANLPQGSEGIYIGTALGLVYTTVKTLCFHCKGEGGTHSIPGQGTKYAHCAVQPEIKINTTPLCKQLLWNKNLSHPVAWYLLVVSQCHQNKIHFYTTFKRFNRFH